MKNLKFLPLLIISLSLTITSCKKKGCTNVLATNYNSEAKKDDGTCIFDTVTKKNQLTFKFTHNYNGTTVNSSNLNSLQFTNAFGTTHSIVTMDYLISNLRLYKSNGDSVVLTGHNLVSLTNNNTLTYIATDNIAEDTYTGIGFNFGFNATDNTSGAYSDLNIANWSWPETLGGGYHIMKFEGKFISNVPDTVNFAYHMGTAREITVTDTIFHANHLFTQVSGANFTISNDATIEIKMNIAEWFSTPNTWDLNTYNQTLMPNYNAQVMMNQNGKNVFTLGAITQ